MLKKISILLALLTAMLLPHPARAAKSSAAQVVNAISNVLAKSPAIEAKFTLRQPGQPLTTGSAVIQGKKFTLNVPAMRVWFDGKTQWTYSKDAAEVNITEPDAAELAETNPLTIITSNAKGCKARRLDAAKGTDRVELTPTTKCSFTKAVVSSDATTNFLREIVVTMNDGSRVIITFDSMKKIAKKPDSYFRFDKKAAPSAQIVDLR